MIRIITAFANVASIVSLAFASNSIPNWGRVLIVFFGIICLIILLFDSVKKNQVNETVCKTEEEINKVMKELIRTKGKICIMSRDLSWVDDELESNICKQGSNLLIFVQKETTLTKRLKSSHVDVKYYGHLNFEPKTRFTVLRYNRNNPQVAIADTQGAVRRGKKLNHTIYETTEKGAYQDKWINSLALDMIDLCKEACKDNG